MSWQHPDLCAKNAVRPIPFNFEGCDVGLPPWSQVVWGGSGPHPLRSWEGIRTPPHPPWTTAKPKYKKKCYLKVLHWRLQSCNFPQLFFNFTCIFHSFIFDNLSHLSVLCISSFLFSFWALFFPFFINKNPYLKKSFFLKLFRAFQRAFFHPWDGFLKPLKKIIDFFWYGKQGFVWREVRFYLMKRENQFLKKRNFLPFVYFQLYFNITFNSFFICSKNPGGL